MAKKVIIRFRFRGVGPTRVIKSKGPKKSILRVKKVIVKRSRDGQVQLPKKMQMMVIKRKVPKKSKLRTKKVIRKRCRDGQVQLPKTKKMKLEASDDNEEETISTPKIVAETKKMKLEASDDNEEETISSSKTSPMTDESIDDEGCIHSFEKKVMKINATADENESETSDS